ncbi:MAG: NRAMP family divalent metal transporter [Rhodospirillaceae bacterium]
MQDAAAAIDEKNQNTPPEGEAQAQGNLWKAVGPGILMACAAIGASHLVWSTRAGAEFGWSLMGLVILANVLKYPFFLYGHRYAAATGESLLEGYRRQGVGYVYTFLGINIMTGIISITAVAMLSGALLATYDFVPLTVPQAAIAVLAVCGIIILFGRYSLIDSLSKLIIGVLTVCTVAAVIFAAAHPAPTAPGFVEPNPWTWATLPFLVMLLGWMPAPVDVTAFSSLWMISRKRQTGHTPTPREHTIDFLIGYGACIVLAVLFVALGALVMHGTGVKFSAGGVGFSKQFVNLYAETIGPWSRSLILTAAFITMFSTALTLQDGYPRSLAAACTIIGDLKAERFRQIQNICVVLAVVFGTAVILFFVKNLMQMLAFASVVSFMTSPILAYINFKVMKGDNVPAHMRPGPMLTLLSWAGLAFFLVMSAGYVYVTFLM